MVEYKISKSKFIEFYTKDRCKLQGILFSKNSKSIIIHLHGMTGNFYRSLGNRMVDYFLNSGFDSFVINTRGHDTIAKIPKKNYGKLMGGTAYERFEDSIYDIKAAVDICSSLKYKNIILMGHSTGCQKGAYYLYKTKDKRISSLVLLAPSDDYNLHIQELKSRWKKFAKQAEHLTKHRKGNTFITEPSIMFTAQRFNSVSSLKRVESRLFNYDGPLKEFSKIKTPILAIFGSKDFSLTKKNAEEHLDILKNKTNSKRFSKIVIKNANHTFPKHEKELTMKVIGWLKNG